MYALTTTKMILIIDKKKYWRNVIQTHEHEYVYIIHIIFTHMLDHTHICNNNVHGYTYKVSLLLFFIMFIIIAISL